MAAQTKHNPKVETEYRIEPIDETSENTASKCERRDDRLNMARRLYQAMCAHYPDRAITLCDGGGRVLEKASPARSPHLIGSPS
ncbi:MAG TPA: hypothetical protein VEI98_12350 [Xanthobacteraceae bacterium]|nr:hypothetical protein [Xanthobacteraceae bacterium]